MPDLSGLDPLNNRLMLKVLIGEPGLSKKTGLYRRYYINMVEKAVMEYNTARSSIIRQGIAALNPPEDKEDAGLHRRILEFTNTMESCINTLSRLFKLLEKISTEEELPALPADLQKLVAGRSMIKIRDTVDRINTRIQNGELIPGNPDMIALSDNSKSIRAAACSIRFEDLAKALRKMHELALYIAGAKKVSQ
jgi:hypothetical protein